jgi:predicted nucleic acid-binding protein
MRFDSLSSGAGVFIDANIFIYNFAMMDEIGVSNLLTNDDDFDPIKRLRVYKPSDV